MLSFLKRLARNNCERYRFISCLYYFIGRQHAHKERCLSTFLSHRKFIWHVAAPKSGSTWFDSIIYNLDYFKSSPLVSDYGRREQEIQFKQFNFSPFTLKRGFYAGHQHIRASEYTINFIEAMNICVVLQVRDVFDTVVSLRDHLTVDSLVWPCGYVDEGFFNMHEDMQFEFIIDMILPWFFNFYATWFSYIQKNPNSNIYILNYEDLKVNPQLVMSTVFNKFNIEYNDSDIEKAIKNKDNKPTRINKGVVGRGKDRLNDSHRKKIIALGLYYPDIDFSLIGLQ